MKKILFITYFWPPSGKASLHWPLDVIRHLPKEEIEPIILTVKDETFTQKDESLLKKIDPAWTILRSKALEPFDIYRFFIGKKKNEKLIASETISTENKNISHKISLWIRLNLFIPDARIGWYFTAKKTASEYMRRNKIDAVVSIGPPHSSHLIGLHLSKQFQVPHFPVLIDPWVDIIYYKNLKRSFITKAIDNYLEKSVIINAKKVVFINKSTEEDYQSKYPALKGKSKVLYWGYDEDDFRGIEYHRSGSEERTIVHAGNIFYYQNPKNFFKLVKSEIDKGNNYKIRFIGTVDPQVVNFLNEIGLQANFELLGFLPYNEMIKLILEADLLLVCSSEPRHVPGKLFEAIRTGNPIIAFGNNNEEVKQIITEANAGMMFNYEESGEILLSEINHFKPDYDFAKKFSREQISKEFKDLLIQD